MLDEADRLLDSSIGPTVHKIIEALPEPRRRQTLLFSATMTAGVKEAEKMFCEGSTAAPFRYSAVTEGTINEKLLQQYIFLPFKVSRS